MDTDEIHVEADYIRQCMRCKYRDMWLDIPMDEFDDIKQNTRNPEQAKEIVRQLICSSNGRSTPEPKGQPDPRSRPKRPKEPTEYEHLMRELDELKERKFRDEMMGDFGPKGSPSSVTYSIRMNQIEEKLARYREESYRKRPKYDDWQDAASYAGFDFANSKSQAGHTDWFKQRTPEKPEDKIMANKFLPFIVEKSTPDHIYRTLLQRSKGMNINLVTSIFWMIADKGVTELRDFVKSLPDGLSVTQMYEEMVGKYSQYQIFDDDLNIFIDLANHFTAEDWQEFDADLIKELDPKDILAFIFVMYKLGEVDQWSDLNFQVLIGEVDNVLSNIGEYALFADDGEATEFYSNNDLKAFILYQALLKFSDGSTMSNPIKVVFVEKPANDPPF